MLQSQENLGPAGTQTALALAGQQLKASKHAFPPCQKVFSLKPDERFTISVFFQDRFLGPPLPHPTLCRSAKAQAASMAPGKIQGRGPIQGATAVRHPGQNGADW